MICQRKQYIESITKAILKAKMPEPTISEKIESLPPQDGACTAPNCDCPKCLLKAAEALREFPVKAKSSTCCGHQSKGDTKTNAGSSAPNNDPCVCSKSGSSPETNRTESCGNVEACESCGCPANEAKANRGPFMRWIQWILNLIPIRFFPGSYLTSAPCSVSRKVGNMGPEARRASKAFASSLWSVTFKVLILGIMLILFVLDLLMVILHFITHRYCVARKGWRANTISSIQKSAPNVNNYCN